MKNFRTVGGLLLISSLLQIPIAQAWDPQPTNPFPGVPFEGEIPGYINEVNCGPGGDNSSSGVDCGIGIVPVIDCPPWSAADGRNGYANDGPPGDPHKKIGVARRYCRNSWLPPTTAADEEDFRNRQTLAAAAATIESQVYSASHPGEQKCVTWGPIVHVNGISTASGGVCANVVGTKPDGTTAQVAPTQVVSSSSGVSSSSSSTSNGLSSTTAVPAEPDYSQYGIGKPFTKKVVGSVATSLCPVGFQAASNSLPGVAGIYGLTECWPENAWAAYSIGGEIWQSFKLSNGTTDAVAEQTKQIQLNALRSLALIEAQKAANETVGLKRCINWSGFGETGQECAYIPVQNNNGLPGNSGLGLPLNPILNSAPITSDSATALIGSTNGPEITSTRKYSEPGVTRNQWESTAVYQNISCPINSSKTSGIDLAGTSSSKDDRWFTFCTEITLSSVAPSETATSTVKSDSATSPSGTPNSKTEANISQSGIASNAVIVSGTVSEITILAAKIEKNTTIAKAVGTLMSTLQSRVSSISSAAKSFTLPTAQITNESTSIQTPNVCRVNGNKIERIKKGQCSFTFTVVTSTGNSYTALVGFEFKK